jgi:hypothetical protein
VVKIAALIWLSPSLNSGTVPSDWKEALITPLFKKGERNVASNYRSVSLTSVVNKILKHITSIALSEFDLVQMPCEGSGL